MEQLTINNKGDKKMAKHGVLFERDNFIPKCINRAGIAQVDIDGGSVVVEGAIKADNDELYTLTFPTSGAKHIAIAYNPSVKYDNIGGQLFPAKSLDDRNYTNIAGKVVDYFIPEKDVEFGVTMANIEGDTAPTVGKFLEITATKGTFTIKDSQTANVPSFEVVQIMDVKYPTGDFSDDVEKVYIVKTRLN